MARQPNSSTCTFSGANAAAQMRSAKTCSGARRCRPGAGYIRERARAVARAASPARRGTCPARPSPEMAASCKGSSPPAARPHSGNSRNTPGGRPEAARTAADTDRKGVLVALRMCHLGSPCRQDWFRPWSAAHQQHCLSGMMGMPISSRIGFSTTQF